MLPSGGVSPNDLRVGRLLELSLGPARLDRPDLADLALVEAGLLHASSSRWAARRTAPS